MLWYHSARYNAHYRIRKARPYEGRLPFDLTFDIRRDEARDLLGEPLAQGDAQDRILRGGPWLRYPYGANEVHLALDFEDQSLFHASVILGGYDHRTGLVSGPGPGPAG